MQRHTQEQRPVKMGLEIGLEHLQAREATERQQTPGARGQARSRSSSRPQKGLLTP